MNATDDLGSLGPLDDEFAYKKLVLRLATPEHRWPSDEDEENAQQFAEAIDPVISDSGLGEINGMEFSAGFIDVLIFGRPADDDVDRIYELLAPYFRRSGFLPGSCLVRCYNNRPPLTSDVVC